MEEKQKNDSESEIPLVRFMIVSVLDEQFALLSSDILEIFVDAVVYDLPFVPPYIEGVINVHGNPYTALNPLAFFFNRDENVKGAKFLIFRHNAHFALHISTAETFIEIPESDFGKNGFFAENGKNETIKIDEKNIKIINPLHICEKLLFDLN